jgi:hypothetical protein
MRETANSSSTPLCPPLLRGELNGGEGVKSGVFSLAEGKLFAEKKKKIDKKRRSLFK